MAKMFARFCLVIQISFFECVKYWQLHLVLVSWCDALSIDAEKGLSFFSWSRAQKMKEKCSNPRRRDETIFKIQLCVVWIYTKDMMLRV